MELPEAVILLDSLGDLKASNTCPILVCGSHCGGNKELAQHIKNCQVQVAFLNNAGIGKNNAGISGLNFYEAEGILACAVDHQSAEIGFASDTWECGIISHTSKQAKFTGIEPGDTVQEAVAKILPSFAGKAAMPNCTTQVLSNNGNENTSTAELKKQKQVSIDGTTVVVTDSITFLNESNRGDIVACGSHGGISAGEYAKKHGVKAVFFNDAGIGKNNAGTKSMEPLAVAGIIACTVDCMSAEIFNGQDVLENGVITTCNQIAKSRNIREKMTVKEAITCI
jgi:hypothetical protein